MRLSRSTKTKNVSFRAPVVKAPDYPINLTPNNLTKMEEVSHSIPVKSDDICRLSLRIEEIEKEKNIDIYLDSLKKLTEKIDFLKSNSNLIFTIKFQQLSERIDSLEKIYNNNYQNLFKQLEQRILNLENVSDKDITRGKIEEDVDISKETN